jgi:cell fate (sporulation/competence/biofilm development) regulator YlbF (YheA/YmcA/DUF963 family)
MEFTQEFIQENGLSEEQVTKLTEYAGNHVADLQKQWDGKANENAEGIISGAGKKVIELTGIQREQGEKWADYLNRANGLYFEGTKNSLTTKIAEYDEKIKSIKGSETLQNELKTAQEIIQGYKQKEAEYDELLKGGYKEKYSEASEKLTKTQQRIAFRDSLPSRPESVNKYEWDAKIKEFQADLLDKNNLVFDENDTPWLVDKENEFKKTKLEDAIKQSESIQELSKGRQQTGLGSKQKKVSIEGLPFELPENAEPKERAKAIKEYLASQNINPMNPSYAAKFAELNKIAMGLAKKSEK